MSDIKKIVLKKTGQNRDIIKIEFLESLPKQLQHTYLAAAFSKCFRNNYSKIILDMTNIEEPSNLFIATIIEATAKVRLKKGDVKLINMSDNSKQIVLSFNSYTYLSIADRGEK